MHTFSSTSRTAPPSKRRSVPPPQHTQTLTLGSLLSSSSLGLGPGLDSHDLQDSISLLQSHSSSFVRSFVRSRSHLLGLHLGYLLRAAPPNLISQDFARLLTFYDFARVLRTVSSPSENPNLDNPVLSKNTKSNTHTLPVPLPPHIIHPQTTTPHSKIQQPESHLAGLKSISVMHTQPKSKGIQSAPRTGRRTGKRTAASVPRR